MEIISFEDLLFTDFSVKETVAINKTVEDGQTFHVLDENRTTSVLVHLKDCSLKYVDMSKKELYAEKGSIVYIPHTAKYSVTYNGCDGNDAQAQLVAFEMHNIDGIQFIASEVIIKLCDAKDNIYAESFNEAVRISSNQMFSHTKFKAVLYSIIADISKHLGGNIYRSKDVYTIAPAVEFLKYNFSSDISVSLLSEKCHISESCFRKLFKKQYGITPNDYIIAQRIKTAKELLQSSTLSINSISEEIGFNDAGYFSKVFKKMTGITPGRYRASFLV